jgi:hypothetical protein
MIELTNPQVVEHVAAPWLADRGQRQGMLPELALQALAVGLGEALRAVHRAGNTLTSPG